MIVVEVPGIPRPQGSKRIGRAGRRGRPILLDANAETRPWRDTIAWTVRAEMNRQKLSWLNGPVSVDAEFRLPCPKRPKHPTQVITKPDADKLLRALLDALTQASVWHDDSQASQVSARKVYATGGLLPGVTIRIVQLNGATA